MTRPTAPPDEPASAAVDVIEPRRFRPPPGGRELRRPRLPWAWVLIALLCGAVGATAWFVLTARSVGIHTTPAHAAISVPEWPALRIGDRWLLRSGARRVHAEAAGYVPWRGVIEVGEAALQSHEIVLERLPGHLRIEVAPVAGADVYVDGLHRGRVPGLIHEVPAGSREIEVRAPRYQTFATTLEVEGKDLEQTLSVTLDPAWALVNIDSVPPAAAVRVDGEVRGTTPAALELLAGRRVVELVKEGYKAWRQTLVIAPGTPVQLGEVVLAEADGQLSVRSTPAAANVTLDGEYQGRTPLVVNVTPGRRHTLRLIRQGYAPLEQTLELAAGTRESLHLELQPELAAIDLHTTPEEAELLIDGAPRGSATQRLELPTVEHELTVRAPGYATYQTRVTPRKGIEKRFRIRLKRAAEVGGGDAAAAATPAGAAASRKGYVTSFGGQQMKLFTGAEVMLGSSRGDPDHRANEPAREVTLRRPFYLALEEVTNADFRRFLATHSSGAFAGQSLDDDAQPVTRVNWTQAAQYCNWLSRRDGLPPFYQIRYGEVLGINPDTTGYRLPTEAEWEWVARFPPTGEPSRFPWGERFPPQGRPGNYADRAALSVLDAVIEDYDDGFAAAAPVASFAPNLHGMFDLDGNVSEWVHDVYDAAPATAPAVDPLGPPRGPQHVVKGASWATAGRAALRMSFREGASAGRHDVGFRIARYAR